MDNICICDIELNTDKKIDVFSGVPHCHDCGLPLSPLELSDEERVDLSVEDCNVSLVTKKETQEFEDSKSTIPMQETVRLNVKFEGGAGVNLKAKRWGRLTVSESGFEVTGMTGKFNRGFDDLIDIEIDGQGYYQAGGSMRGFGTTADAAAKAQYQAAIINSFTTRTKVDCHLRLSFENAELNFALDISPRELAVKLSGVRNWLTNQRYKKTEISSGFQTATSLPFDNIDKIIKLSELVDKGLLSKEEFAVQKAKLLG